MSLHQRIETSFETWGYFVVRQRWLAILLVLGTSAVFVSWLPEMKVDNSIEAFLHEDDPERVRYDRFRDRFGSEDRIMIILNPPEIFDLEFLEKLRAFHRELERELPYTEEVTSLLNARYTHGEDDALIVEELLEEWPRGPADLVALKERVLANPLYINLLISESAAFTTISIKPYTYSTLGPGGDELAGFEETDGGTATAEPAYLTDEEGIELVKAVREVSARYEAPDFPVYLIGGPTMNAHMTEAMARDVSVLMSVAILVIAVLLYLLFRRVSGVLLPLLVVILSLLSTLGIMVWLGIPFSSFIQILPAFLLTVGVCDAVHILVIAYRRLAEGMKKADAIASALGHSGLAVVMTSVTTAGGLLSFSVAELAPISHVGVIAPIGIMLAMAYTLLLLPALLAVLPLSTRSHSWAMAGGGRLDRLLARVGDIATTHPWKILAGTACVLVIGLNGVLRVYFANDPMKWFPETDPLRIAVELFDREFKGAATLEVLIDTGRENGLYEPETLERIEQAMRHSETLSVGSRSVSKAVSIVDVVKETHQALNENQPDYYVLPGDRQLIAQELLLFENSGSDDLEQVTDSQFSVARVSIRTPWVDDMLYPAFLDRIEADFREILGEGLEFELTGGPVLFSRTFKAVIISMTRSYVIALLIITPLMILLIGNLRRGLYAMLPNLIPVFLVLALMGWLQIPLDMTSLLMGGVILGLAVDDTIHFMHKFNRYFEDTGDARLAVRRTLETTGSALLFTSLVLSLGFSVFLFAYMVNIAWFGVLGSSAAVIAFLADVLVAPALMVLVTRGRGGLADASLVPPAGVLADAERVRQAR